MIRILSEAQVKSFVMSLSLAASLELLIPLQSGAGRCALLSPPGSGPFRRISRFETITLDSASTVCYSSTVPAS